MLAIALLACSGCAPDCETRTAYADQDGDGFGGEEAKDGCAAGTVTMSGDCDDQDADRSPAQTEVPYDGIDQDCDGSDLDDVDGDTFPVSEDCDDEDPTVFPGADEVLYDGIDQDCDGLDADDLDEDGYGIADDCDDDDAGIHPAADELCGDGLDNDCDGASDDCVAFDGLPWLQLGGEIWGHKTEAGVTDGGARAGMPRGVEPIELDAGTGLLVPSMEYGEFGDLHLVAPSLGSSIDIRDEAKASIDLTDYTYSNADYSFGAFDTDSWYVVTRWSEELTGLAYVFPAETTGPLSVSDAVAQVKPGSRRFESESVACDVDGSGSDDLTLAYPRAGGVLYLITDPVGTSTLPFAAESETEGQDEYLWIGQTLACADLDGDGDSELVTGVGIDRLLIALDWPLPASSADGETLIPQNSDRVSGDVEFRDLNGDGSTDALVDATFGYPDTTLSGSVHTDLATGTSAPPEAPITFHWQATGNLRPHVRPAGDINGDGHQDFIAGDESADDGRGVAWIHLGPLSAGTYTIDEADGTFSGTEPDAECDAGPNCINYGSWVGKNVNGIGDVNLDGYDDIAISAPHHSPDPTLHGPGVVYLFFGGE